MSRELDRSSECPPMRAEGIQAGKPIDEVATVALMIRAQCASRQPLAAPGYAMVLAYLESRRAEGGAA